MTYLESANLATLAEEAAARLGERRGLVFEGQGHTNWELLDQARRLQGSLAELGVGRGDIVALCMVNHPLVYPVFQGIFRTGGAAVPVMFQLAAPELRFVLEDTAACGVVTDLANLDKVREAVQGLASVRFIVVRGGETDDSAAPAEHSLEELLQVAPRTELPQIGQDELALVLYSSGTTGRPKGAMLSHGNLLASARQGYDAGEVDTIETPRITISAMPMAHIFGVGVMNGGYMVPERLADGYMVQLPWFDARAVSWREIQEHRLSVQMPAVPTMLALILSHPQSRAVRPDELAGRGRLRRRTAAGRASSGSFSERFGCQAARDLRHDRKCGSWPPRIAPSEAYRPGLGRPGLLRDIELAHQGRGRSAAAGRGARRGRAAGAVEPDAWDTSIRPEATDRSALRGGWLRTGDIGYLDDEGYPVHRRSQEGHDHSRRREHLSRRDRRHPLPASGSGRGRSGRGAGLRVWRDGGGLRCAQGRC